MIGERPQIPVTHNPSDPVAELARSALSALQDFVAGGDGWGSEGAIHAIDDLCHFLRLPEWCATCSHTDGFSTDNPHTTYSHYVADERHWVRCAGPCEGCDRYEAEDA